MPWHRLINSNARPRDDYLPKNEKRVEPSESVCRGAGGAILLPDFGSKVNHIFISIRVRGRLCPPDYHPATRIFRSSYGPGQRGYFTEPVSNLVL